jgi:hypothetical protein
MYVPTTTARATHRWRPVVQFFTDPLQDEFASWALGYVGSSGADLGEIVAIAASLAGPSTTSASAPTPPDDGAFYDAVGLRPPDRRLRQGHGAR